ncbi:MAG: hypothetical protein ACON42_07390 [Flavobacteriaceae bacterium]
MNKIIAISLLTFVFTFHTQAQKREYSFKESFQLQQPISLTISSTNSDIEVIAHEKEEVIIYYSIVQQGKLLQLSKAELEQKVADQWKFNLDSSARKLKLEVYSTVKSGFIEPQHKIDVHFKVCVPKRTTTELTSSDGDIKVKGLSLDQKCHTHDGNIQLTDIAGDVDALSSDGDIFLKNVEG